MEVGGSLKSLMREWMDWKREGAAGLGRMALWASLLPQNKLCTSIPSPCWHWSQDISHGHSCPCQHPTPARCVPCPCVPHCSHLLGGSDEIHGLQAGQWLPALVDVFHNLGGKRGIMGRALSQAGLLDTPGWMSRGHWMPHGSPSISKTPQDTHPCPQRSWSIPAHPIPAGAVGTWPGPRGHGSASWFLLTSPLA